ncbi:6798_t:CDS:2, partial [Racocetra fulgida]
DLATSAVAYTGSICKAENESQNAMNESHVELSEHEACSPTDTSKDRLGQDFRII